MMRQAQQKTKQAIDQYNREVRIYNQKVKQAVDTYNREVRAHNTRVRSDRQRLKNEIAKLGRQNSTTTRSVTFRTSVRTVQTSYERLDRASEQGAFDERYSDVLDLSEREAANSAGDERPARRCPGGGRRARCSREPSNADPPGDLRRSWRPVEGRRCSRLIPATPTPRVTSARARGKSSHASSM